MGAGLLLHGSSTLHRLYLAFMRKARSMRTLVRVGGLFLRDK